MCMVRDVASLHRIVRTGQVGWCRSCTFPTSFDCQISHNNIMLDPVFFNILAEIVMMSTPSYRRVGILMTY